VTRRVPRARIPRQIVGDLDLQGGGDHSLRAHARQLIERRSDDGLHRLVQRPSDKLQHRWRTFLPGWHRGLGVSGETSPEGYAACLAHPQLSTIAQDLRLFRSTLNLYVYVSNSPINLGDPLGLAECAGGSTCENDAQYDRVQCKVRGAFACNFACNQLTRGIPGTGEFGLNRFCRETCKGLYYTACDGDYNARVENCRHHFCPQKSKNTE